MNSTNKSIIEESIQLENISWPRGIDGSLIIKENESFTLQTDTKNLWDFETIVIKKGGQLIISGKLDEWIKIGCKGNFVLEGKIIAKGCKEYNKTIRMQIPDRKGNFTTGNFLDHQIITGKGGKGGRSDDDLNLPISDEFHGNGGGGNGGDRQEGYNRDLCHGNDPYISFKGKTGNENAGGNGGNGIDAQTINGGGAGGNGGIISLADNERNGNNGVAKDGGGGGGGGGGGARGCHGACLFIRVLGKVLGPASADEFGIIDISGTDGGNGGNGGYSMGNSSGLFGGGGGGGAGAGAGGMGGYLYFEYTQNANLPSNWKVLKNGGKGGKGGTGGKKINKGGDRKYNNTDTNGWYADEGNVGYYGHPQINTIYK